MKIQLHQAFHSSLQPQQAFVAIFDVLGFKDRVAAQPLPSLVSEYSQLIRIQGMANNVKVVTWSGLHSWVVGRAIFSDTILLWCDDTWDAVQTLVDAVACTISDGIDSGWPFRCGIAYGPCVMDNATSLFVGQAIVDAHKTEQNQNWVGGALHPSVLNHATLGKRICGLDNIIQYPVPVKNSALRLNYAFHWGQYSTRGLREVYRLAGATRDWKAKRKYVETHTFLHTTCHGMAVLNMP